MKILIKGVNIIGSSSGNPVDIAIAKGRIIQIDKVSDFSPDKIIDAQGLQAVAGFIDLAARLREPGPSKRGTIKSESKAATGAGFSTICVPPDTEPVIDNPAVVELIQQRQEQAKTLKILPLAAMTQGLKGQHLGAVGTLKEEGCVGVSNALAAFSNTKVLFKALQYAKSFNLTAHLHPINQALSDEGSAHQGEVADHLGLPGISQAAETTALSEILMLAEETGAKVHICRVSCARSLELIREAKQRGIKVTADVAIAQLFYSEDDLYGFDPNYHVIPPLRTKADKHALRQGLLDGTLDAICSDHQPHDVDSKLAPFSVSSVGMSTLDSFIPDVLKLCKEEDIKLEDILPALNQNPAKVLGQSENEIAIGNKANFFILDTEKTWQLTENNILSKGKNNPHIGEKLTGQVVYNIIGGKLVFARTEL